MARARIFFIMGVAGSGKTTIGEAAANSVGIPFIEGDDFHPEENIEKMSSGIPLEDGDRWDWLASLNSSAQNLVREGKSAVISCSALKQNYRSLLRQNIEQEACFILLRGSKRTIQNRIENRAHFFSNAEVLARQFDDLELPNSNEADIIDTDMAVDKVLSKCIDIIEEKLRH